LFWNKKGLNSSTDLRTQLDLDNRPIAVAYTNMTYESSVAGKDKIFQDQFHWIQSLVKYFSAHTDFQLIIRIHPAEVRDSNWRPNESLYQFILTEIDYLPDNIRVIAPQDKVSSYSLGSLASIVLVYSSTIGIEMVDRGKAVITAAHVHYSNKGFTTDPTSKSGYFMAIENALQVYKPVSEHQRDQLIDYVAWLYARRLTPFEAMSHVEQGWPEIKVSNLDDICSPHHLGIQRILRLITEKKEWW
jgi:hypothetical protein